MAYTISEVAKQLGVAPSTLRYYEAEGLLPAVKRTANGRRQFLDSDVEACRVIECLKRSGLAIKQIKDFMLMVVDGDATLADRLALFQSRREAVKQEIRELQQVLDVLDFKTWYYEQAVAAGSEDAVRALLPEQVPSQHQPAKTYLAQGATARSSD